MDFSLFRPVKIDPRALKIGARTSLSCTKRVPSLSKSGPEWSYSGPDFSRTKMLFWWLEFEAQMLGFGARIGLCWKFKFFYFSYFPCCLSLLVNSKHHENNTKNNVMTIVINPPKRICGALEVYGLNS